MNLDVHDWTQSCARIIAFINLRRDRCKPVSVRSTKGTYDVSEVWIIAYKRLFRSCKTGNSWVDVVRTVKGARFMFEGEPLTENTWLIALGMMGCVRIACNVQTFICKNLNLWGWLFNPLSHSSKHNLRWFLTQRPHKQCLEHETLGHMTDYRVSKFNQATV